MENFTTFQIASILDIPRERLQEWIKRGFIKPSIQEAKGQGTKNIFNLSDLYGIYFFEKTVSRGTSREFASKIFEFWQKNTKDYSRDRFNTLGLLIYGFNSAFSPKKTKEETKVSIYDDLIFSIVEDKEYDSQYIEEYDRKVINLTHPDNMLDLSLWEELRVINLFYVIPDVNSAIVKYINKQSNE